VIATPKLIAAAQIGDGVAVAGDGAGNLVALTTAAGENILTRPLSSSHLTLWTAQMNLWRGKAANIALLSDGLQLLALELNQGTPHVPFFLPLSFMANVTNETEAKEQLVVPPFTTDRGPDR